MRDKHFEGFFPRNAEGLEWFPSDSLILFPKIIDLEQDKIAKFPGRNKQRHGFDFGADLEIGIGWDFNPALTGGKGFEDGVSNSATLTVYLEATAGPGVGMMAFYDLSTPIIPDVLQSLAQ